MKRVILFLSIIPFATVSAAADAPRLALLVAESIGADADPGEIPRTEIVSEYLKTTYDDKGCVIRRENETGVLSEYTYHPQSGKLLLVLNKDLKTEFSYDEQGNLTRAENSNGQVIDLDYAKTPLIQRMVEVNRVENTRRELTFKYNKAGRPTEITLVGVGTIVVEYDDNGEISKADSDGGAKVAIQVTLAFQNLLRVVKVAGERL